MVFPSSFDPADAPVVPLEKDHGPFPYGPRALNIQTIEKLRRRKKRSVHHHRYVGVGFVQRRLAS